VATTAATVGTTAGLGVLTKILIVAATVLVLGGAGTGGYVAYTALTGPSWPSGQKVAYVQDGDIWLATLDGSMKAQVTRGKQVFRFDWGTDYIFYECRDGSLEGFNIKDKKSFQVTPGRDLTGDNSSYLAQPFAQAWWTVSGNSVLYINPDKTGVSRSTVSGDSASSPETSSCGTGSTVDSICVNAGTLYALEVNDSGQGGRLTKLPVTRVGSSTLEPFCSLPQQGMDYRSGLMVTEDGKKLATYVTADESGHYYATLVDFNGTLEGEWEGLGTLSPDGRYGVGFEHLNTPSIGLTHMPYLITSPDNKLSALWEADSAMTFSPDSKKLIYRKTYNDYAAGGKSWEPKYLEWQLEAIDPATLTTDVLFSKHEDVGEGNLQWSADGKYILAWNAEPAVKLPSGGTRESENGNLFVYDTQTKKAAEFKNCSFMQSVAPNAQIPPDLSIEKQPAGAIETDKTEKDMYWRMVGLFQGTGMVILKPEYLPNGYSFFRGVDKQTDIYQQPMNPQEDDNSNNQSLTVVYANGSRRINLTEYRQAFATEEVSWRDVPVKGTKGRMIKVDQGVSLIWYENGGAYSIDSKDISEDEALKMAESMKVVYQPQNESTP